MSSPFWGDKNVFRILADLTHLSSKLILIGTIHYLHSAEGISLLTQALYLIVFLFRYLDLFWTFTLSAYNTSFKIFYIVSSIYTIWLMMAKYKRSREVEREWKVAGWSLMGSIVVGTIGFFAFGWPYRVSELLWNISIVLESFHLLPQISLLSHVSVATAITSYYLVALGSYRALYIANWILRYSKSGFFDPMPFIFGVVQTLVYIEFAWIYWTRQQVKLRSGEGVFDEQDFAIRGWGFLRLIYAGGKSEQLPSYNESVTGGDWREWGRARWSRVTGWGGDARGLSVSADEEGIGGMLRGSGSNAESSGRGTGKNKASKRDLGRDEEEGQVLVGDDSEDEAGVGGSNNRITLGSDESGDESVDGLARD